MLAQSGFKERATTIEVSEHRTQIYVPTPPCSPKGRLQRRSQHIETVTIFTSGPWSRKDKNPKTCFPPFILQDGEQKFKETWESKQHVKVGGGQASLISSLGSHSHPQHLPLVSPSFPYPKMCSTGEQSTRAVQGVLQIRKQAVGAPGPGHAQPARRSGAGSRGEARASAREAAARAGPPASRCDCGH